MNNSSYQSDQYSNTQELFPSQKKNTFVFISTEHKLIIIILLILIIAWPSTYYTQTDVCLLVGSFVLIVEIIF